MSRLGKTKKVLLFITPVIFVSLLVLWPSFNLHLTGDDYLGLWRYHYYLDGYRSGQWNNFNFFLTDYGPQDTFTAIIHYFVGFQPIYYYIISYLLRLLAALSFFPLIYHLTKNKWTAYMPTMFFAITTAGLETTDWSFNMPSYLAIAILNIFLLFYLKSKEKNSFKFIVISSILFYFTIIFQPIRMTFLPGLILILELYTIIKYHNFKTLKYSILRLTLFTWIAIIIYITGFIGNSIGAGETLKERLNGGWTKVIGNNFSSLYPYLFRGEYQVFAYPFAQFGNVIIPSSLIPTQYQLLTVPKAIFKLLVPLYLLFVCVIYVFRKGANRSLLIFSILTILLGTAWSIHTLMTFVVFARYPFNKSQFLAMLAGGYTTIILIFLIIKPHKYKMFSFGIFLGILLTFLSFTTPWLRSPSFLYESTGRYLIVPAVGFTILLGILLGYAKDTKAKVITYSLFSILFLVHMYTSFSYLYHLSTVRGIKMTENIRKSIPFNPQFKTNEPIVYYFEPANSEVLHHALLFGFPVFMGNQYNFFNVWHLVYTDDWNEVTAAYKNGSTLKRFSIPIKKVKLDYIYSFRLDGNTLINTTQNSRQKLSLTQ